MDVISAAKIVVCIVVVVLGVLYVIATWCRPRYRDEI